jgi:hypothetical protein
MNNKSEVSKKKKNMHIIRKMVLLRDMEDEIAKELKLK